MQMDGVGVKKKKKVMKHKAYLSNVVTAKEKAARQDQ